MLIFMYELVNNMCANECVVPQLSKVSEQLAFLFGFKRINAAGVVSIWQLVDMHSHWM